jgi:branched-chain amino acid transport system permease protein
MARANRAMVRNYADDLRLAPTWTKRVGFAALLVVYLLAPWFMQLDIVPNQDEWANVLALAGIVAIGAIGLNLLTGYTGQPSLGQAAFIGLGAFVAGYYGGGRAVDGIGYDIPLVAYLLIAAVGGGFVGLLIGLPALRLRGNYLAIVTLGLVFLALYLWRKWTTFTGGNAGSPMPIDAELSIGVWSIDFLNPTVFGKELDSKQGLMYLSWGLVIVVALLVKNIVRTRPGRALQAVRDRDIAAEVIGVSLFRYKVGAFVISSAIAAVAGALYGLYLGYLTPNEESLGIVLSIQYLAVIVVGGIGTIYGSILGAVLVGALPTIIDEFVPDNWDLPVLGWPIVTSEAGATGFSKGALATAIYAVLIILFLVIEPRGLAGFWRRIQAYFKTWPFSY